MKCASEPSSYMNWTFFTSVWTRANFSPARKVLSTTAPRSSDFSFVRTNAPPLPGFTCWNSTMRQTPPSCSMCIPLRNWFVSTVSAIARDCRGEACLARAYPTVISSFVNCVSRSAPVSVTSTRSSMRTPPSPGR